MFFSSSPHYPDTLDYHQHTPANPTLFLTVYRQKGNISLDSDLLLKCCQYLSQSQRQPPSPHSSPCLDWLSLLFVLIWPLRQPNSERGHSCSDLTPIANSLLAFLFAHEIVVLLLLLLLLCSCCCCCIVVLVSFWVLILFVLGWVLVWFGVFVWLGSCCCFDFGWVFCVVFFFICLFGVFVLL